ncbi:MAG: magnesium transporter CorA family protein [Ruminococcus sp.]|nr:magnesium transporter CorA family protein [Oscillospiraceae bacterium]MDY4414087.1 magnesium transporter CorA family protein [Ruminococcus sp.]
MIKFYKTFENKISEINSPVTGCWVSVTDPTPQEIKELIDDYGLDSGFVKSSLDDEETSRIEREDNQTLIIVDSPVSEVDEEKTLLFYTIPIGIIITEDYVFTISVKASRIIEEATGGIIKNLSTNLKTRFVLQLLLRIITLFLIYLKQIDKISSRAEQELHDAMKNKLIMQLLELEKSLVYFSTSLKANEVTIEKIYRGRVIKLYDEDQDLLEDVLIEIKQAIDMSNIYSSILSSMMEAFSSVISNNLNFVMWRLTVITVIMAIPTMVYSFYGMNTTGLPMAVTWFPSAISVVLTLIVAFLLLKMKKK